MANPTPHFAVSPSAASSSRWDVPALTRALTDDGYFVLPGAISKGETEAVQARLTQGFEAWKGGSARFQGGGLMSGHLNCYPGEAARGVHQEMREIGLLDALQAVFPTNPKAARWGCNFNLPGSVEQHYHIDGIFLEAYLVVNVCIVDTTLHNGAIDVIPGTHRRFYKYWEFAARRISKGSTRIPMSRGDVLVRLSTVWHRGMPNFSKAARPMLALTLGEKEVNTDNVYAHNDGQIEFQPNWFRTDLLGQIRERTTVMAPITYSAYRFARSLIGNKGYASF
jgi:hypothetical protein